MRKIISLCLCAVMLLSCLASCGVDYTDEEVIKAAEKLIPASYDINEIYFGKGLPVEDRFGAEEYEVEEGKYDVQAVTYLYVTLDCGYTYIDEIKKDTEKVYSKDYCNYLFKIGFEGVSEDDKTVVYAKYIENEYGMLTARSDLRLKGLDLNRTYDLETIKVTKKEKDKAEINVQSLVDGKKDVKVTLSLALGEDGWRLDTPTY